MSLSTLQKDYALHRTAADAFLAEFLHQFSALLKSEGIKLGVPLEGRVKEWESIAEKVDRKGYTAKHCKEIPDLIGVRAISLFKRDATKMRLLINNNFLVSDMEDKASQLDNSKFGYLSHHFHIKIPDAWRSLPSFGGSDFSIEIQVRTLSQHLWAASSHLLQYKKEADVPPEVSRSIHRVAALLETVDLEFERVLEERDDYSRSSRAKNDDSMLDADNIALILDKHFPSINRDNNENYSQLITDFTAFGIETVGGLKKIIKKHLPAALKKDKDMLSKSTIRNSDHDQKRINRGVYFTHVGLARTILAAEVGDAALSEHFDNTYKDGE